MQRSACLCTSCAQRIMSIMRTNSLTLGTLLHFSRLAAYRLPSSRGRSFPLEGQPPRLTYHDSIERWSCILKYLLYLGGFDLTPCLILTYISDHKLRQPRMEPLGVWVASPNCQKASVSDHRCTQNPAMSHEALSTKPSSLDRRVPWRRRRLIRYATS